MKAKPKTRSASGKPRAAVVGARRTAAAKIGPAPGGDGRRTGGDGAGWAIRPAKRGDLARIWELIRGLAVYEKLEHRMTGSPEQLAEHLFGKRRIVDCLVAEEDGDLVGFAIYYLIYSTFRTQPMMWLEDLFVEPSQRGRGTGRELLLATAREAERLGCWRLSWAVLDWNEPAMKFYEAQGARRGENGWYVYEFDEKKLKTLAAGTARATR